MTAPTPILVATDIVVFKTVAPPDSDLDNQELILFIRRKNEPWKGMLALPGGFVDPNERTIEAAARELREETSVAVNYNAATFIGLYDDPDRDPRGRVITVAYYFNVGPDVEARAGDDAAGVEWLTFGQALEIGIAADHEQIIFDALFDRQKRGWRK